MRQTDVTQRLLVIRLGAMGDVLHASPSVRLFKALRPQTEIHWLTSPLYADLVRCFEGVDRVWTMPSRRLNAMAGLIADLRRGGIDAVVSLHASLRMRALAAAVLAPHWGRDSWVVYRKQRHALSAQAERMAVRRHATEDFFEPFRRLIGPDAGDVAPEALVPVLNVPSQRVVSQPLTEASPCIALIPGVGARRANRAWPLAHSSALLARLLSRPEGRHARALLIGGPEDEAGAQAIRAALPPAMAARVESRCGHDTILQTASRLAGCSLVIGADTGPTHLAAAVGAPLIALFGPTSVRRTGPRGPGRMTTLVPPDALACWPCEQPVCPHALGSLEGSPCMAQIPVEAVLDACLAIMARSSR